MPEASALRIAVVIVSWDAREQLEGCLGALAAQRDPDFEIVVVDNGSTDGTAAWLRGAHPRVRIVVAPRNLGFAQGCNLGVDACAADWIATLNDDARPEPGWLGALRTAADAAAPRVGMLQSEVRRLAQPEVIASTGVVLRADGVFEDRDAGRPAPSASGGEVFCASAAAALYRRRMLEELRLASGTFDRGCFAYFEDVDLGWRARLAGWEARWVSGARVLHAEHASAVRMGSDFVARQCRRNRVRVLAKNASWTLVARAVPRLLRDFAAQAREGPREVAAWLAAAVDGLRQRGAVGRLARVPRRVVESRWIDSDPRRSLP